jgi:uncharacterized protein DUF4105
MKPLIALLLMVACPLPLVAQDHVYWGFVSTGSGVGVLGHGFLLFKSENTPLLLGDAYQYNFDINVPEFGHLSPPSYDQIKFVALKQEFYELLLDYSIGEDRSVRLYELNLNEEERGHLLKLVTSDLRNPDFAKEHTYGFDENCISRPIQLLNQVVSPNKKIAYLGPNGAASHSYNPFKILSDPILNRIPFYIGQTLENHPISKGPVKYYEGKSIRQAQFLSETFQDVHKMTALCHWALKTERTIDLFLILYIKGDPVDLNNLVQLARSCPDSKPILAGALAVLYQGVEPDQAKSRTQIYKVVNGLLN